MKGISRNLFYLMENIINFITIHIVHIQYNTYNTYTILKFHYIVCKVQFRVWFIGWENTDVIAKRNANRVQNGTNILLNMEEIWNVKNFIMRFILARLLWKQNYIQAFCWPFSRTFSIWMFYVEFFRTEKL